MYFEKESLNNYNLRTFSENSASDLIQKRFQIRTRIVWEIEVNQKRKKKLMREEEESEPIGGISLTPSPLLKASFTT